MHLQKKLRGVLRCDMRAWHLKQPPQNQLQLAECSCRKICTVGCGVLRGFCS